MDDRERQRAAHLMLLLIVTVMGIVLAVESVLLGWNMEAVLLLWVGAIASWIICVTEQLPAQIRLWLYVILSMLAFFFYGVHETSVYDLAPVMIMYMVACIAAEKISVIRFCLATYILTIGYDILFVIRDSLTIDALTVSRLVLHVMVVCLAAYLIQINLQWKAKERKKVQDTILLHEEMNRRTENFLANVSHELRTPINAVIGMTSVMLKKPADQNTREQLFAIQQAGNRLFGQIEDILDYTEIDTDRILVNSEPYMITSVINDLIVGSEYLNRAHAPELILDIDARLPAVLEGDVRKIKKILKHLVVNAIKFTKKGGIYVRVYAREKEYGVNLCVQVSDTGEGITPEHMAQITERFCQSSEGRNRQAGGLGLGLPIVYGLVAAMGGFVQLQSKPDNGTTVLVSIPQKVVDETHAMMIEDREKLRLACYLNPRKYELPEVHGYYDEMIRHMVCGLDIQLHRASDEKELRRLLAVYQLTHLIVGSEEYEENPGFYERLDRNVCVIVVAGNEFHTLQGSRTMLLKKPFYALSLAGLLNSHSEKHIRYSDEFCMICPGIKVLVVDDEPMNLMVAQGIFGEYQMKVTTATSGHEAIEICKKEDFDLLFLDHMMPEMDGVETLHRIRRLHTAGGKDVTAVAFTANAVSSAREMFAREGFDEFVSKPVETIELERVLRKLVPSNRITYIARAGSDIPAETKITTEKTKENPKTNIGRPKTAKVWADWIDRLEAGGINTEQALRYSMSDPGFYRRVLERFCTECEQKIKQLQQAYESLDIANYRICVHALKSTARMIGADALSELARKEEDAAKNNDMTYLKLHHEECMECYKDTMKFISDSLEQQGVQQQQNQPACENISLGQLKDRLAQVRDCLDTFEAERAQQLLDELSDTSYDGVKTEEMLSDIRKDIEEFEIYAATEKLQALQARLEGGEAK